MRCMVRMALAALLAGAFGAAPCVRADGRFVPVGPSIDVPSWVEAPAVGLDAGANFVIAWHDTFSVWGRRFDARGRPRGQMFEVRAAPAPWQVAWVRLAVARDGAFVVLWQETAQTTHRVLYAAYTADGQYAGETSVMEIVAQWISPAAVAFDATSTFLIAWHVPDPLSYSLHRIMARRFDLVSGAKGPAFQADAGGGFTSTPHVAADGFGNFLIGWTQGNGPFTTGFARWFDAADVPFGPRFSTAIASSLCSDANGRLVVVYRRGVPPPPGGAWHFARRYARDGQVIEPELQLSETDVADGGARVACSANGDFVAAWLRQGDNRGPEVYARRFAATGQPDGREFRVNDLTGQHLSNVALGAAPAGHFAVAWEVEYENGSSGGAQAFSMQPRTPKGDFDGEGHADLVLRHVDSGALRVWAMHEGLRQSNRAVWPLAPDWAWHLGAVDDFDGDGRADLLLRHQTSGAIDIWLMGGTGGVECVGHAAITGAVIPGPDWIVAAAADFDRDGDADLLWRNRVTQKLAVWLLDKTAWRATRFPTPDQAADANWVAVGAGDFDGDGWSDLLFYNTASGAVVQWLLDGELVRTRGRFTSPARADGTGWNVSAVADYGIGAQGQVATLDLLWRNDLSGKLVIWHLDRQGVRTSGVFTTPTTAAEPLAWTVVGPR